MKHTFLLFIAILFSFTVKAQVIFNTAMYNPAALPSGMAITEVDGTKYLQVSLNGWENKLQVSATNLTNFEDFYTTIQYKAGTSGVAAASMVSVLQLVDTTADIYTKLAEISVKADPNKKYYAQNIIYPNNTVNQIKFVLRETTNWTAVSGDTLLISLVEAMPKDNGNIFDPATIDPNTLPEGMEIVEVESEKMLKVQVMGWDRHLPIPVVKDDVNNRIRANLKYENEGYPYELSQLEMYVLLTNNGYEVSSIHTMPEEGIFSVEEYLQSNKIINDLRVAVLTTSDWTAIDSAYVYIGKIEAFYESFFEYSEETIITDTTVIKYNPTQIIVDGEKDTQYTNANNIARVAWGVANQIPDGAQVKVAENADTYAQWYSTFDDTNVYFYITVKDDDMPNAELANGAERLNNGLEMMVSLHILGWVDFWYQPSLNFLFIPGQSGVFYGGKGLPDYFEKNDTTNIRYVSKFIEGGYTIELAIPFITLFTDENATISQTIDLLNGFYKQFLNDIGLSLDFNLLDADTHGNLKSILCWGNNTGFDLVRNSTLNYRGDAVFTGQNFSSVGQRAAQNNLKVFPNPFNSRLVVNSAEPIKTVKIYNLVGQLIMEQTADHSTSFELDVQNVKSGMYVVQSTSVNGNLTSCKVLKE